MSTDAAQSGIRADLSRAAGRLSWGVVDQGVTSAHDFVLNFYVVHEFGATTFGAFSLALVTFGVVLNATRGAATDPLMVRYSGSTGARWRGAVSSASATATLIGGVCGVVFVLVGLLLTQPLGAVFITLGLLLPGMMLQDSFRYAFFALGRPALALINDVVWGVLLLAALVLVHLAGRHGETPGAIACMLATGGTATLAGLYGRHQTGARPRLGRVRPWLVEHRQLSLRYLLENVSASGSAQIRASVLGAVAGLASVGYLRGAEILMGPFVVIQAGVGQVAVPEAARILRRNPGRLPVFCGALGIVEAAAAMAWWAVLLVVLPLGLGRLALGTVWPQSQHLLLGVAVGLAIQCFVVAITSGLRAMGVARRSLRAGLINAAAYVALSAAGVITFGVTGAVWGAALANAVGVLVCGWQLRAALRDHAREPADVATDSLTIAGPSPTVDPAPP
jgi:O-antigen/teichoic acid export membrane protein